MWFSEGLCCNSPCYLIMNGIDLSYKRWIWHGKSTINEYISRKRVRKEDVYSEYNDDHVVDMVNDAEETFVDHSKKLTKLLEDAEKPLYPSSKMTILSFLVRLYNLKDRNG